MQDEVLAHRLGLIPLKVDPALFEYKTSELTALVPDHVMLALHTTAHNVSCCAR